ncbi:LysR family transcriptional regulator [Tamilnaduibacter salinus]|uniref:LysR family transcriptional regulator n=1 Tax=Tamilnaduibacter salinus TaxID=1484056 RepID=A0A2A2I841_9GAMM|nr:LysR family transcriptional regulator [Tamilnaduibacter salinus]PAV27290.1 LysR family transcriptional regulator [Tamilnaduibacter salinus]
MALNRLDLNLLHVFDTIYREGSLTRAAQALHLTQPAVSHSLSRLRDHFDDPLFTRQGNRMVPTPLARRFAESMRPGLTQIQTAVNQFHAFDPRTQRKTFALGLRDVLESTFLPPLMRNLTDYPEIDVVSQRLARRDMETALASGKLDFAVDVLLPVSNQTSHELLRRDRLVVIAGRHHPAVEAGLTLDDYLEARHVLVSSRTEGPGVEDFELSRLGVHRRIALRCQHYFAACRVAETTDLLVTMPETYARIITEQANVKMLPMPTEMPAINVHLYWHRAYEQEPALLWFREQLHGVAEQ